VSVYEDLAGYESRLGQALVTAIRAGGETLLARVEGALGPAERHMDRIRRGVLKMVPAVRQEIERSIAEAEQLAGVQKETTK